MKTKVDSLGVKAYSLGVQGYKFESTLQQEVTIY